MQSIEFPKNFNWGAATASYQIEGAYNQGNRGLSVWDMLCRQPGKIYRGHTGDIACDHYNRYKQDIELMKTIGLKAYRFSISWSRILPDGTGAINEEGLAFYDNLIDGLLEAGIEPWITLFHWDYPYSLYLKGGWFNPESSDWFAAYTKILVDRYSDRVSHWFTLNEPQCFVGLGHERGIHAPGLQHGMHEVLIATHNVLLSHGKATRVIRDHAKKTPKIGWAPVGGVTSPKTNSSEDIEAARSQMFAVKVDRMAKLFNVSWWADPVVFGHYPEDGLEFFGDAVPKYSKDDMAIISQKIDFYGMNVYESWRYEAGPNNKPQYVDFEPGSPLTSFKWDVTPECLYWGARFLNERYDLPVVVTENGLSNQDWIAEDGKVHDPQRIDYLSRHLKGLHQAIDEGIPIEGYFQWSLMDNFEWAEGYRERFGLIYIDYTTQERILKDSAFWYKKVIETNGKHLADYLH